MVFSSVLPARKYYSPPYYLTDKKIVFSSGLLARHIFVLNIVLKHEYPAACKSKGYSWNCFNHFAENYVEQRN